MRSNKKLNPNPNPKPHSILTLSFLILTIVLLVIIILVVSSLTSPRLRLPEHGSVPALFLKCTVGVDKFLWYAPHSGFSNQLSELKNALLFAAILNRTLVVPPVLDHHAVALGSCSKFRVLSPPDLRLRVWDYVLDLIRHGRYISMADIIDLSSVSTMVRTVDFSYFISLWCGIDLGSVCSDDSDTPSTLSDRLKQCGLHLSGVNSNSDKCSYAVDVDCRTTVWTYQQNVSDMTLDSYQPDEQLQMKRKISFVRHRKDVLKHLGPGSEAHLSSVLAFGSLFTRPYKGSQSYIDIRKSPSDKRIQPLLNTIEFLPFVPEIKNAGKKFAETKIGTSFLCAQVRLLDGQFKNHWEATFSGLKQKVDDVKLTNPLPVHVFVMTDLHRSNWNGTYLDVLANDASSFKVHVLDNEDEIVKLIASKLAASRGTKLIHCPRNEPDLRLYIEETICSCASLGFVRTAGSTIAENIELMRKNSFC
ncbi:hypothetical protein RND81_04G070800 [Saponaria officinalis]|uniref:O-fucosyltransferase family protein n=1 Tax=Saponaria officinalis TaxID=3572 RepID=A0AAW1LH63_SAPOF